MRKKISAFMPFLSGITYSLLLFFAARGLVHNAKSIFGFIAGFLHMDLSTKNYISEILEGLGDAELSAPWVFLIILAVIFGAACVIFGIKNMYRAQIIAHILAILLFIPLLAVTILLSDINGICPARILRYQSLPYTPSEPEIVSVSTPIDMSEGESWNLGYGSCQIIPDKNSKDPLYIAGYNNGLEISGVLDLCEARAVWLDAGSDGILMISVDCIGLDSGVIADLRSRLSDMKNCASISIAATHTHAGADTLGLWGPLGIDGKNEKYMESLYKAVENAARAAYADRKGGNLYFGSIRTANMFRDSRDPQVYDPNIYQLRFEPEAEGSGLRILFYGAHAESLRGDNSLLSRDFPGALCDSVAEATGDNAVFFSSAAGGLIMTREFVSDTGKDAVRNLEITSEKLIGYALALSENDERLLRPSIGYSTAEFTVPMDNIAFSLYRGLGILTNRAVHAKSATGYGVQSELSVMFLGDIAVALIPGEPFPELITGAAYGDANPEGVNPEALESIAEAHGIKTLLTVGLANDEIGYIVPPSDFIVHDAHPYIEKIVDYKGENHYEETNSVGPACADAIAKAFSAVMDAIK